MPKTARAPTRTANISPRAADMLAELARASGESVREFVDRVWVPQMQAPYEAALKARLKGAKGGKP
jgi:hypothetical protein